MHRHLPHWPAALVGVLSLLDDSFHSVRRGGGLLAKDLLALVLDLLLHLRETDHAENERLLGLLVLLAERPGRVARDFLGGHVVDLGAPSPTLYREVRQQKLTRSQGPRLLQYYLAKKPQKVLLRHRLIRTHRHLQTPTPRWNGGGRSSCRTPDCQRARYLRTTDS